MADAGMGAPAIIGMVGGIIGLLGGVASFRDRFYKGRPIASLTTRVSSGRDQPWVLVRIKNTTDYDVFVSGTKERMGIYYLAEGPTTLEIIHGQRGKSIATFNLKPDETKELTVMAKYKDNVAIEALGNRYVEFLIFWRRGNATWLPQIPIPVCSNTATIRELGGVE